MEGIVSRTPAGNVNEYELPGSTNICAAVEASKFSDLPLKWYIRLEVPGLKKVTVGPLEPPNAEPSGILLAIALDPV